ncbi:MAG: CRISPR-associated endonuclease Cas1 [Thermoplasmata archaeon]|nr:CRISPR-associated endonuclease Cas1 [Thermoplasmata archaeon]
MATVKPLLLTTYGTCLKTSERKLVLVNQDSGKRLEWSPSTFPYDSIVVENLGGFVTFPALRWLATNGISLTALDYSGGVLASYLPDWPINSRDRLAQLRACTEPAARIEVARFILEAKLNHPIPSSLRTIQDLLLYEAHEADRYWKSLGIVRDYPNARDPTNSTINYAFGLLESRARLAVHRLGLEPSVGFLHESQNYKSALVYDVMEPFRDDAVKVALAVRRKLTSRDFGDVFGHGVRLRPEGAHRLVREFGKSFRDDEMIRFTSRLALRFSGPAPFRDASSESRPSTRPPPRTSGRTANFPSA